MVWFRAKRIGVHGALFSLLLCLNGCLLFATDSDAGPIGDLGDGGGQSRDGGAPSPEAEPDAEPAAEPSVEPEDAGGGGPDAGKDPERDAGLGDAGSTDAGGPPADAGSLDGGRPDAGALDAGGLDAGVDAGEDDAGPPDAGPPIPTFADDAFPLLKDKVRVRLNTHRFPGTANDPLPLTFTLPTELIGDTVSTATPFLVFEPAAPNGERSRPVIVQSAGVRGVQIFTRLSAAIVGERVTQTFFVYWGDDARNEIPSATGVVFSDSVFHTALTFGDEMGGGYGDSAVALRAAVDTVQSTFGSGLAPGQVADVVNIFDTEIDANDGISLLFAIDQSLDAEAGGAVMAGDILDADGVDVRVSAENFSVRFGSAAAQNVDREPREMSALSLVADRGGNGLRLLSRSDSVQSLNYPDNGFVPGGLPGLVPARTFGSAAFPYIIDELWIVKFPISIPQQRLTIQNFKNQLLTLETMPNVYGQYEPISSTPPPVPLPVHAWDFQNCANSVCMDNGSSPVPMVIQGTDVEVRADVGALVAANGNPNVRVITPDDTCSSTNNISVVTWFHPDNAATTGPGRIFARSRDSVNQEFFIGQDVDAAGEPLYIFRDSSRTVFPIGPVPRPFRPSVIGVTVENGSITTCLDDRGCTGHADTASINASQTHHFRVLNEGNNDGNGGFTNAGSRVTAGAIYGAHVWCNALSPADLESAILGGP